MGKTKKFASKTLLESLEDSIGFLSNYKIDPLYDTIVVNEKGSTIENVELTKTLQRLGELNEERDFLIEKLLRK